MAFKSARCTRYENITDRTTGEACGIIIGGIIEETDTTDVKYAEYTIQGPEFDALPAADPELEHTPADPRFQAIQIILLRFLKRTHTSWAAQLALTPVKVSKLPEEIVALPVITELPDVLPPEPDYTVTPVTGSQSS
jgi:hypothetical protein